MNMREAASLTFILTRKIKPIYLVVTCYLFIYY